MHKQWKKEREGCEEKEESKGRGCEQLIHVVYLLNQKKSDWKNSIVI